MARRRPRLRRVRTHHYQPGEHLNWRGEPFCNCGKPKINRAHKVAPVNPQARIVDARRLGEHPESEDQ